MQFGEILGAVAVLITLGYLAVQMRQNTRAMKAAALSSLHDVHLLTENNERYIAALIKLQRSQEVPFEERIHMVERFTTIVRRIERVWFQLQLGGLSLDQFNQHLDILSWAFTPAEARRMWTQVAPTFDPGFRAVVGSEVLGPGAPTSRMNKALAA